jgi:beta-fructofuranosidase
LALRLDDKWIWDFWLTHDGERHHLFFLQAPRSLGDPDLRHVNATIGHAVSTDLSRWTVVGDALGPGPAGTWDEIATWTGSVVRHDDRWYMFYTGARRHEGTNVQRIGAAISSDLIEWVKLPGPLIGPDPRWYETIDDGSWFEEAWRDPWLFAGHDGRWHALITARGLDGPADGRGVVGHAVSDDLLGWEVLPPITAPGEFGHLEVPQVVDIGGRHGLVFSCDAGRVSRSRRDRLGSPPSAATYVALGETALGPFDLRSAQPALPSQLYSGRLVTTADGSHVWLAFVSRAPDGSFPGTLTDPIVPNPPLAGW